MSVSTLLGQNGEGFYVKLRKASDSTYTKTIQFIGNSSNSIVNFDTEYTIGTYTINENSSCSSISLNAILLFKSTSSQPVPIGFKIYDDNSLIDTITSYAIPPFNGVYYFNRQLSSILYSSGNSTTFTLKIYNGGTNSNDILYLYDPTTIQQYSQARLIANYTGVSNLPEIFFNPETGELTYEDII